MKTWYVPSWMLLRVACWLPYTKKTAADELVFAGTRLIVTSFGSWFFTVIVPRPPEPDRLSTVPLPGRPVAFFAVGAGRNVPTWYVCAGSAVASVLLAARTLVAAVPLVRSAIATEPKH